MGINEDRMEKLITVYGDAFKALADAFREAMGEITPEPTPPTMLEILESLQPGTVITWKSPKGYPRAAFLAGGWAPFFWAECGYSANRDHHEMANCLTQAGITDISVAIGHLPIEEYARTLIEAGSDD